MGKIKSFFIAAAAAACPIMAVCGGTVGQAVYTAAYISSGAIADKALNSTESKNTSDISTAYVSKDESPNKPDDISRPKQTSSSIITEAPSTQNTDNVPDAFYETEEPTIETMQADNADYISKIETYESYDSGSSESENGTPPESYSVTTVENPSDILPEGQPAGRVISRNIEDFDDGLDISAEGTHSGKIVREHYKAANTGDYVKLLGGGEVRNCTELSAQTLADASGQLPDFIIEGASSEPQVLIIHTHTTESYEPYQRDYYDINFPSRTRSSSRNMTAVGENLAKSLAAHGITVLHDGTVHDYPVYTGAYDRSEETIRAALEEYPSIKVVIDLHRDAIENSDGTRIAPVTAVNGKNAAQYMIISGCDDGRFNMPNYMENFKFACLIQSCSEELYPGLARPVLFDYRNYNQHLTTGSLLIEVGSHANSFDEAMYTGELLGDVLARALQKISQ